MRRAFKNIAVSRDAPPPRLSVDSDAREHAETMAYELSLQRFATQTAFLEAYRSQRWIRELHDVLKNHLQPGRSTLGIGSGLAEHELLLSNEGFQIAASDISTEAVLGINALFPSFSMHHFDIFEGSVECDALAGVDDVLITGLDYCFDNVQLGALMQRCAAILLAAQQAGTVDPQLIFVVRYNDNSYTWLIDRVMLPFDRVLLNIAAIVRRHQTRYISKAHGYRRRLTEVAAIASDWGLELCGSYYAGAGIEATRSATLCTLPGVLRLLERWDETRGVLSNCHIMVFGLNAGGPDISTDGSARHA